MKGIIIFGTMGSGKDTLAAMLTEKLCTASIYKLGENIRGLVDATAPPYANRRKLYQEYGQQMRAEQGEDVWNKMCKTKIEADTRFCKFNLPIIADGRQINEYHYWKDWGFYTVGIESPLEMRRERLKVRDGECDVNRMIHDTELQAQFVTTQLADYSVDNDCSLEYLEYIAEEIANIVMEGD